MDKDFIQSLKEYNEKEFSKDIFIPSLGKKIKFAPLTVKHQKQIIGSIIDNPLFKTELNKVIYDILKEVTTIDIIDSLNVFDKDAILFQLKYHFFIEEKQKEKWGALIESYESQPQVNVNPFTISDNFQVTLSIPTVKKEFDVYQEFSKLKKYGVAPDSEDQIRNMVSDLYILELIKWIDVISINEKIFQMSNPEISITDKMEVVDALGRNIGNQIVNIIAEKKEDYNYIYTIDDKQVEIDMKFFS